MPSMQFIDFEYGCHSYRGYDWGNHFCEYAGFECAYSRYPDKEHVALFIRAYLSEGATSPPVSIPSPQSLHCLPLNFHGIAPTTFLSTILTGHLSDALNDGFRYVLIFWLVINCLVTIAFPSLVVCLQSDEEVEAAVAEGNFFALVSHQFWGIWALIQARYSPIDFDYFGYSKLRWDEYYRRKEEFLRDV